MIEKEQVGDVCILRLCHGKASALDIEFLQAISATIQEVEESNAKACVITGTGSIFSAGVDLKRLLDGGPDYLAEFMPALDAAFSGLYAFSKPLIAACNGHAIAGGCVILSSCDLRYVAAGKSQIGVPELRVGVPFPLLALEIMRAVVPRQHLQEVLYGGATYPVDRALAIGLCDQVVPADEILSTAMKTAEQLASYPAEAFAFNKRQLRRPTWQAMSSFGDDDGERAMQLWCSDSVQEAVRAYVAKTLG
ncbi:MAG: enoyl-CoA hydratase [Planctomycetota bacterium]|jgi:enoyl-CoA hydratase